MSDEQQVTSTIGLTAGIVSAYVASNPVNTEDIAKLIDTVHRSLIKIQNIETPDEPNASEPPVPIKKSVTGDYIICLEDGKRFRTLKRHLRTSYNMTPEQYRAKWGLPRDYPMVAPNYSATRSQLAKASGLGRTMAFDDEA